MARDGLGDRLSVRRDQFDDARVRADQDPISRDTAGDPNYWVVTADDPALFRCPVLDGRGRGPSVLDGRSGRMREYLLKGGFLWVDDFWGTPAWQHWSSQIKRVLPEHPIFDSPPITRSGTRCSSSRPSPR